MNRRAFLGRLAASLAAVAVAAEVDPERLLWVPGAKTIFLPPAKTIETVPEPALVVPDNPIIQPAYDFHEQEVHRFVGQQGYAVGPRRYHFADNRGGVFVLNAAGRVVEGTVNGRAISRAEGERILAAQTLRGWRD